MARVQEIIDVDKLEWVIHLSDGTRLNIDFVAASTNYNTDTQLLKLELQMKWRLFRKNHQTWQMDDSNFSTEINFANNSLVLSFRNLQLLAYQSVPLPDREILSALFRYLQMQTMYQGTAVMLSTFTANLDPGAPWSQSHTGMLKVEEEENLVAMCQVNNPPIVDIYKVVWDVGASTMLLSHAEMDFMPTLSNPTKLSLFSDGLRAAALKRLDSLQSYDNPE